jgi:hypothetical protein
MANFRYVGDNRHINTDHIDELRLNDSDGWVQVLLVNGREIMVDRQYIEDLLVVNAIDGGPVAEIELVEEVEESEEPKATKRK